MDRMEALRSGATRYFTGKPCIRGHVADRYARNGGCVKCMPLAAKKSINQCVTEGDLIKAQTKKIFLYAHELSYPAIKMTVDAFITKKFPNINPDYINNYPFRAKQINETVFRIKVCVPIENVEEMYLIGKSLLYTNSDPQPRLFPSPA